MKAIFVDLDKKIHIDENVNFSCSQDGNTPVYVGFTLDENPLADAPEGAELTGDIIWASDDDFAMRVFSMEEFLRYELEEIIERHPGQPELDEDGSIIPVYDEEGNEIPVPDIEIHTGKWRLLLTTQEIPPTPEPIEPPPPPPEPTEEELLAELKSRVPGEITSMRDQCIAMGVYIQTEYGVERFSLEERDKTMIMAIYTMVQSGVTSFPYHSIAPAGNQAGMCTVYSDADIAKIAVAAFAFITFHESYANMLAQWLERVDNLDEARRIQYGADLPYDLQEYLEMVMYSAASSAPEGSEFPLNMPMAGSQILLPGMIWAPPTTTPEEDGEENTTPEEGSDIPDVDDDPSHAEQTMAQNAL